MADTAAFQPYDKLNNKTFHGLLIAEFLAAFNDQCIHASAMFFAIRTQTLNEGAAIALMPLLFYSPWALFAPLSGYLADRYSKRSSLIFWKVAEVGITGLAMLGFWLGSAFHGADDFAVAARWVGPWLVMSTVFLMGTHSAFYVPNKYGVLPEIFTVRLLSRANGFIESTTFLAVILGTTAGGVLSSTFEDREVWIGIILVGSALVGTLTSLLIRRMPPADPNRPFPGWLPWQMFRSLLTNLGVLARSRLASVAVLGLAFFTFMVAFMRGAMYMFGESQNPRWDDQQTSLMVAVVSLGVGLGSPLAGSLSGGKIELGMVPLAALGIVVSLTLAAASIFSIPALIVCLILIGLFSSFYLVPLYSLLQYSAPKGTKGTSVATNNFIAVTGAILASLVFFVLVNTTRWAGIAERLHPEDVATGTLRAIEGSRHGPKAVVLEVGGQQVRVTPESAGGLEDSGAGQNVLRLDDAVHEGATVTVSGHTLKGLRYYYFRPAGAELPAFYNQETVPRYLFLVAAVLMLGILTVLSLRLPDFWLRALLWLRSFGRAGPVVTGYHNLPQAQAVLVTNGVTFADCGPVISGVVRPIRFVLPPQPEQGGLLTALARRAHMLLNPVGEKSVPADRALDSLRRGYWLALSTALPAAELETLLAGVERDHPVPVIPVVSREATPSQPRPQVIIGEPLAGPLTAEGLRQAVEDLDGRA